MAHRKHQHNIPQVQEEKKDGFKENKSGDSKLRTSVRKKKPKPNDAVLPPDEPTDAGSV